MKKETTTTKTGNKADLRLIPKKYRKAFTDKKDAIKDSVLNNFGNQLSLETVTLDGLVNSVNVDESAIISSSIVGNIVPRRNGKGLDLRHLKKEFRKKYKEVEGEALARMERAINEKVETLGTITNEDFADILAMCNTNPFLEKFVTAEKMEHTANSDFENFLNSDKPKMRTPVES